MGEYIYSLTDFLNDTAALGALTDQIIAAGLPAPRNINMSESAPTVGTVSINFSVALTAPQITTLNGVVAAHDGVPNVTELTTVAGEMDGVPVVASGVPYTSAV